MTSTRAYRHVLPCRCPICSAVAAIQTARTLARLARGAGLADLALFIEVDAAKARLALAWHLDRCRREPFRPALPRQQRR